mmetsp:Transcript_3019/g.5406  ORF Transcript_3019/g.5406 Transcript_3019/m.5406 type:complete len:489 (+) Transcript_3019:66-1532(+)
MYVLVVLLLWVVLADEIVRIEFSVQGGGQTYIDYNEAKALTLGQVYEQVVPFCTTQGLQNEECDFVVAHLFDKKYTPVTRAPDNTAHAAINALPTIIHTDVCLAQQVIDYCAHHAIKLGHACNKVFSFIETRLMRENHEVLQVPCAQKRVSHAETLLSLEALQLQQYASLRPIDYAMEHESALKQESSSSAIKGPVMDVWIFWATGAASMPPLVKYTYYHNLKMCKLYGHRLHLVTLDNILHYFKYQEESVLAYLELFSPAQQADVIRLHLLYTYGGIWLDADFIIISDVHALYKVMTDADACFLATEEFEGKIGNAVLASRLGSPVVAALLAQLENELGKYADRMQAGLEYMHRDFMGPQLIRTVVHQFTLLSYPSNVVKYPHRAQSDPNVQSVILSAEFTLATMHIAGWQREPLLHYHIWLRASPEKAQMMARELQQASLGIVGLWTLGSVGNDERDIPFWDEVLLRDERSLFYQLFFTAQRQLFS